MRIWMKGAVACGQSDVEIRQVLRPESVAEDGEGEIGKRRSAGNMARRAWHTGVTKDVAPELPQSVLVTSDCAIPDRSQRYNCLTSMDL
ncbi:hypothetical protein AcV5_006024 [Taiwanofungus camphoratus]|nr:hypothetical protein AcV7_004660 [Antrodia cinnamomea]KAI0934048.1 hypothetical protein AcV5_006024 [Antrodia cinnamomea]